MDGGIAARLDAVRQRIVRAAQSVGRDPSGVRLVAPKEGEAPPAGLHPSRSARLVSHASDDKRGRPIGTVGEIDPDVAVSFGLTL